MPINSELKLPQDVTARLFRMVEARLRTDAVLRSVVKAWQSWEGVPTDKTPPSVGNTPWVGLTPVLTGEDWYSPETQVGVLQVRITVAVEGTCVDDVLNFWGLIRRAFYNPGNKDEWIRWVGQMKAAGAHKGTPLMQSPVTDSSANPGQDNLWVAAGLVSLDYRAPAAS